MHDLLSSELSRRWSSEAAGVRRIAGAVMNLLADRSRDAALRVDDALVAELAGAMVDFGGEERLADALTALRQARVPVESIVERYIPAAARRLGCDWVNDRAGFSAVTIGCARLQRLVRDLGAGWSADAAEGAGGRTVLLVVPDIEDHTLGAVVAAGALRRRGYSVCLRLKPSRAEYQDLVCRQRFDAVMISFANVERLEYLEVMAKSAVAAGSGPVIAGGAIADRLQAGTRLAGVSLIAADAAAALRAVVSAEEPRRTLAGT